MEENKVEKRLICCSFAAKQGYKGQGDTIQHNASMTYLRNACVSCYSAKKYNPYCDVAFVHNLNHLPDEISAFLKQHGILDLHLPFDHFTFPPEYKWSLAFYKLSVLYHMAFDTEYQKVLLLDTDTIFLGNIDAIWSITEEQIMLYNVQHSLELDVFQRRLEEYRQLYDSNSILPVWGGEFIAGSTVNLRAFVTLCEQVYHKMIDDSFVTQFGDEFITFCAAAQYSGKIYDATPYIRRYWTTNLYYQVYTDHVLCLKILHIPNEKNDGFIRIYNTIQKTGDVPKKQVMFKILGLPSVKRPNYLRNIVYQLKRKVMKAIRVVIRR